MTAPGKDKSAPDEPSTSAPLKRRGDNVGQSGRWGREEDGKRRYGNEEGSHSTEQASATPARRHSRSLEHTDEADSEGVSGTPRRGGYEGPFSPRGEEALKPDVPSQTTTRPYSDAGGATADEAPIAPDEERWDDERAEGHGKDYGRGRDSDSKEK